MTRAEAGKESTARVRGSFRRWKDLVQPSQGRKSQAEAKGERSSGMPRPTAVRVGSETGVALGVGVQELFVSAKERESGQDVVAHEESVDESGFPGLVPSLQDLEGQE